MKERKLEFFPVVQHLGKILAKSSVYDSENSYLTELNYDEVLDFTPETNNSVFVLGGGGFASTQNVQYDTLHKEVSYLNKLPITKIPEKYLIERFNRMKYKLLQDFGKKVEKNIDLSEVFLKEFYDYSYLLLPQKYLNINRNRNEFIHYIKASGDYGVEKVRISQDSLNTCVKFLNPKLKKLSIDIQTNNLELINFLKYNEDSIIPELELIIKDDEKGNEIPIPKSTKKVTIISQSSHKIIFHPEIEEIIIKSPVDNDLTSNLSELIQKKNSLKKLSLCVGQNDFLNYKDLILKSNIEYLEIPIHQDQVEIISEFFQSLCSLKLKELSLIVGIESVELLNILSEYLAKKGDEIELKIQGETVYIPQLLFHLLSGDNKEELVFQRLESNNSREFNFLEPKSQSQKPVFDFGNYGKNYGLSMPYDQFKSNSLSSNQSSVISFGGNQSNKIDNSSNQSLGFSFGDTTPKESKVKPSLQSNQNEISGTLPKQNNSFSFGNSLNTESGLQFQTTPHSNNSKKSSNDSKIELTSSNSSGFSFGSSDSVKTKPTFQSKGGLDNSSNQSSGFSLGPQIVKDSSLLSNQKELDVSSSKDFDPMEETESPEISPVNNKSKSSNLFGGNSITNLGSGSSLFGSSGGSGNTSGTTFGGFGNSGGSGNTSGISFGGSGNSGFGGSGSSGTLFGGPGSSGFGGNTSGTLFGGFGNSGGSGNTSGTTFGGSGSSGGFGGSTSGITFGGFGNTSGTTFGGFGSTSKTSFGFGFGGSEGNSGQINKNDEKIKNILYSNNYKSLCPVKTIKVEKMTIKISEKSSKLKKLTIHLPNDIILPPITIKELVLSTSDASKIPNLIEKVDVLEIDNNPIELFDIIKPISQKVISLKVKDKSEYYYNILNSILSIDQELSILKSLDVEIKKISSIRELKKNLTFEEYFNEDYDPKVDYSFVSDLPKLNFKEKKFKELLKSGDFDIKKLRSCFE